jgi:hypothetical protein
MRLAGRYAAEVKTLESKGSQSTVCHLFSFSTVYTTESRGHVSNKELKISGGLSGLASAGKADTQ